MKKRMTSGLFSLLIAGGLVLPSLSVQAADDNTATVTVRVAGANGMYYEDVLNVGAESYVNASGEEVAMEVPSAMGALVDLLQEEQLSYVADTTAYGVYVKQVGELKEKAISANTGWTSYINGQAPNVAADLYELHDGDVVTWAFVDWTQTLYPQVDLSGVSHVKVGDDVKVKVTAEQTTYDENWNPTVSTVAVEGATLHVQGDDETYVTDANGEATLTAEQAGALRFYVDKQAAESGLPLVVRSAWNQVIAAKNNVAFTDLSGYAWASEAVSKLADLGAVVGDGQGHFLPNKAVTRAELAKMLVLTNNLSLTGNREFTDVAEDLALRPYIEAAAASGLMVGDAAGTFRPDAPVSREELAVVLVRLAHPTEVPEIAPNYSDMAQVQPYAQASVQTAAAIGVMVGDPAGTFRPQAAALRAEVAQALVKEGKL
ncbi:MAG TPA: S-layer homology domain-containing protein [Bacilli bacterium]|nr:S-layer homology domain-containing protein [Bacilli bacterium]